MNKNRVLFFSSVSNPDLFRITGFYVLDIKALINAGFEVEVTNKFTPFLKFWKYDIAFLYFYKKSILPGIISWIFNKYIFYTGGIDELNISNKYSFISKLKFNIFFVLNYLISNTCNIVSKEDFNNVSNLLDKYKINKDKIKYFPHCIDNINYFKFSEISKGNIITTICWMGTEDNVRRKGVDKALYIFKEICNLNPEFNLYIVGTYGKGKSYLDNIIKILNLSNNVIFTGPISENDKLNLLNKSKFYFQISKYEGFGIAVIEAMFFKNFIIHSGEGGLKDTIRDGGLIVTNKQSEKQIAKEIMNINNNINNVLPILDKNKDFVNENFSLNTRSQNFKLTIENENK